MKYQLKDGRYLMASWQDIHNFFVEYGIVGKTITDIIPQYYDFRCGSLDAIDRVYALNEYSNICTDGQICIVFSDGSHLEFCFLGDGPVLLGYNTADFTTYSKYDGKNYNIRTLFQYCFGRTITDIFFEKSDTPMEFPIYYGERSSADDDGIDMSEDDEGIKYIDFLLDDGTRLRGDGSFDEFGLAHLDAEGNFIQKVPYQQLFNEMNIETLKEIFEDEPETLSIIEANRFSDKKRSKKMKISVLDVKTLGNDLDFSGIHNLGDVTVYDLTTQEQVVERIQDAEVLILNKVKLNKDNLPYAKNLKLVCITATGFDNVDIDYCREHGIAVCNVVGYSTDSVVQLTVSMAFSLATNLLFFDKFVKSGDYTNSGIFNRVEPVFRELSALTWGVVGLGSIGGKVANIAKAMGCRVLAYKRTPVAEFNCVDLDTLCRESDIITVHTPLNDGTFQLINEKRLAQMKDGVVLVNVARGAVFDEEAVTNAVLSGKIGGLGVDVYSTEPMQADSPYQKLLDCDNVIFTPHMAWGAMDARQRCIDEIEANIKSFIEGGVRSRLV